MQQDQMNVDADRPWEFLVPTCRTIAMRRQKLQGAGWDNGPHSVTERRSAKFVLSEFAVLPPISHHGNMNEIIGKLEHKQNSSVELTIHGVERTDETGRLCRMISLCMVSKATSTMAARPITSRIKQSAPWMNFAK